MISEHDAIRAFLAAAGDLLPFCNEDAHDYLVNFIEDVREHVADNLAELEAKRDAHRAESRRVQHRKLMDARGIRVVKGGK